MPDPLQPPPRLLFQKLERFLRAWSREVKARDPRLLRDAHDLALVLSADGKLSENDDEQAGETLRSHLRPVLVFDPSLGRRFDELWSVHLTAEVPLPIEEDGLKGGVLLEDPAVQRETPQGKNWVPQVLLLLAGVFLLGTGGWWVSHRAEQPEPAPVTPPPEQVEQNLVEDAAPVVEPEPETPEEAGPPYDADFAMRWEVQPEVVPFVTPRSWWQNVFCSLDGRDWVWLAGGACALVLTFLVFWLRAGIWREAQYLMRQLGPRDPQESSREFFLGLQRGAVDLRPLIGGVASRFRQHERLVSSRLDGRATVSASIKKGGFFTPVRAERPETPEYLFLLEERHEQDHLGRLVQTWTSALRGVGVAVAQYRFHGTPERPFPAPAPGEEADPSDRVTLRDLTVRYPRRRLVVFGQDLGPVDPFSEKPAEWFTTMEQWETSRALLTPPSVYDGEETERWREGGWTVFDFSESGVRSLGNWLAGEGDPGLAQEDLLPPLDLIYAEEEWLSPAPVESKRLDRLEAELKDWLGEDGFFLLRACAVFPVIDWHLTRFLEKGIRHLPTETKNQEAGATSEEVLFRLSQLPWMREGQMPEWLREHLLTGLSRKERDLVTGLVHQTLEAGAAGKADYQVGITAKNPRKLRRLARSVWEKLADRYPELEDELVLENLSGVRKKGGRFRLPKVLASTLRWSWPFGLGAAGLVAVYLALRGVTPATELDSMPSHLVSYPIERADSAGREWTWVPPGTFAQKAYPFVFGELISESESISGYYEGVGGVDLSDEFLASLERLQRWDEAGLREFPVPLQLSAPNGYEVLDSQGRLLKSVPTRENIQVKAIIAREDGRILFLSDWSWDRLSARGIEPALIHIHKGWQRVTLDHGFWMAKEKVPLEQVELILPEHELSSAAEEEWKLAFHAGGKAGKRGAELGLALPVTFEAGWPVLLPKPKGGAPKAGDRREFEVGGTNVAFRWCPPGKFVMGSPPNEEGRSENETQHPVTLTQGYWMAETETTQGLWEAVISENPSEFKTIGAEGPVENVSWEDVQGFLQKLNASLPAGESPFRLPTEAEWEYACRAGTTTAWSWGSEFLEGKANVENDVDSDENKQVPFFQGKGLPTGSTMPVKTFDPNPWGLYDMHGSVWEWCQDWYEEGLGSEPVTDPTGPLSGSFRAFRGGSWYGPAAYCRSAYRSRGGPSGRSSLRGFRLARGSTIQPTGVLLRRGRVTESRPESADWGYTDYPSPPANAEPGAAYEIRIDEGVTMTFRYIPAGEFTMGSPTDEEGRIAERETQHPVKLTKGFWMAQTEITQAQWRAILGTTVAEQKDKGDSHGDVTGEGADYPMYFVNWNEADEYAQKLGAKLQSEGILQAGWTLELPTEAQWEYAARAGTTGPYNVDGSTLERLGWYVGNSNQSSQPVGIKIANKYGLHDMHGNVWEWCQDWYEEDLGGDPVSDPTGPESGVYGVNRGGSWSESAMLCRSAYRVRSSRLLRFSTLGFRLALVPPNPSQDGEDREDTLPTQLREIGDAGSDAWDSKVKEILVGAFDEDASGLIDTEEEVGLIGPNVYRELNRLIERDTENVSNLPRTYGFQPNLGWLGYVLGFDEEVREVALKAMEEALEQPGSDGSPATGASREEEIADGVEVKFLYCPPGSFQMGSPVDEVGREPGAAKETPHQVTLTKGFWLAETETTQGQWEAVMGENPSGFKDVESALPVENVSWEDITKEDGFLDRIQDRAPSGMKFTLPTEAQWEYACRARTETAYPFGNEPYQLFEYGNFADVNSTQSWADRNQDDGFGDTTAPVRSYRPNPWGFYDMHGNVYEWVQDWFSVDLGSDPVIDPTNPKPHWERISRGGSWSRAAVICRSANRAKFPESERSNSIGFRLALIPSSSRQRGTASTGNGDGGAEETGNQGVPLSTQVDRDYINAKPLRIAKEAVDHILRFEIGGNESLEEARAEFLRTTLPTWSQRTSEAYVLGRGELHPLCNGALLGNAYNRGTSFSPDGKNREMYLIREAIRAENFEDIPALLREQAKHWPGMDGPNGLQTRRLEEASLFEKGLELMKQGPWPPPYYAADDVRMSEKRSWGRNDVVGPNHPIWNSGELHPSLVSRKDRILGIGREGLHRHTIRAGVLYAASAAAHMANNLGYHLYPTSGNRWLVSATPNHGQDGEIGDALAFVISREPQGEGDRLPADEEGRQGMYDILAAAVAAGANAIGWGRGNGAGSYLEVDDAQRGSPSKDDVWNYDDGNTETFAQFEEDFASGAILRNPKYAPYEGFFQGKLPNLGVDPEE